MFRSTLYKCFLDNDRHGASTNSLGSLFCCLTTLRVNKFFLIPSPSLIIRTNTKLLWAAASSIWLWLDPAIIQGCQEVHASPSLDITRHGSPWFKQQITFLIGSGSSHETKLLKVTCILQAGHPFIETEYHFEGYSHYHMWMHVQKVYVKIFV